MKDKYDLEIDRLMEGPIQELPIRCEQAWYSDKTGRPSSCLFDYCTPTGMATHRNCGCLTQVRNQQHGAWTPELTAAIQVDSRLPYYPSDITTREQLEIFAEWQRRLDREIRNDSGTDSDTDWPGRLETLEDECPNP